jgi:hypothetical protein
MMAEFTQGINEQLTQAGAKNILSVVPDTNTQALILGEIVQERRYQNMLWGIDRANMTEEQWISVIDDYTHNCGEAHARKPDRTFKERMLKTAALAVAALEWAEKQ